MTTPPMDGVTVVQAITPAVRQALLHLRDAKLALERPMVSQAQVDDAMRSADHFMRCAKQALSAVYKE